MVIKKPRANGTPRLLQMEKGQQEALAAWLIDEKISYGEAKTRLRERFHVTTSDAALSAFWQNYCVPRIPPLPADIASGKVLLDVQIPVPSRLRVVRIGAESLVTIHEGKN